MSGPPVLESLRRLSIALVLAAVAPSFATPPFPSTFVLQQPGGGWRLHNDYLGGRNIFFKDSKRRMLLELDVRDVFSDGRKYIHDTTAGPHWSEYAHAYFVSLDGKPHFALRTWWDGRVLVDLNASKQVPVHGREAALDAAEKAFVLETLGRAKKLLNEQQDGALVRLVDVLLGDGPIARRWTNLSSAHLAGRLKLQEAIPLLHALEGLGEVDSCTTGDYGENGPKEGEVSPENYCTIELRRVVHLSLRRLGERVGPHPVTVFHPKDSEAVIEAIDKSKPRAEKVGSLEIDMAPAAVLKLMGAPDYVERGRRMHVRGPWPRAWRYDIDADAPYSLLVVWENRKVARVEKVIPGLWHGNDLIAGANAAAVFDADGSILRAEDLYSPAFRGTITRLK